MAAELLLHLMHRAYLQVTLFRNSNPINTSHESTLLLVPYTAHAWWVISPLLQQGLTSW